MTGLKQYINRIIRPVTFCDYTRVVPVDASFGFDRGQPVDRYYIEQFLSSSRYLISGNVLEVGDSSYSRNFGQRNVTAYTVLNPAPGSSETALHGDLTDLSSLPEHGFDCFICTQTFNFIFDVQKAVYGAYHLLKPGGVLLSTVAGICQISRYDMDRWGDYWRFTTASVERLFTPVFGDDIDIVSYGNVMAAISILQGVAVEDLPDITLLDRHDHDYQVIISIVARKDQGAR